MRHARRREDRFNLENEEQKKRKKNRAPSSFAAIILVVADARFAYDSVRQVLPPSLPLASRRASSTFSGSMTVWERLRNPCGWRAGAKQISVDAMLPLLVVPTLAVIAAQTVFCTVVVFAATPILVYYLYHNFLRFLLRTKFFLMWTITSVLMLMLVFEISVVPLLEILPEENLLFMVCVVGGIWCGYRAKLNADVAAQEGAVVQGLELGEGSGELCVMCRRRAPPRAYHCRLCQTCILNREYHCKWYNEQ